ncbi:hypothetical protein FOCC_FOCC017583 [Frankliniella occidentalis]|nr:hypothetical protein FOCC_FOCC017583 [Frankliniella occidentalis]
MEFLERTTSNVLVMLLSPAGVLTPVLGFPTNAKGKSSYFIRKRKEPVTKENLRDLLIFGDMAPRPVEELAVLVDEVFMPLLVNPVNQRGWPTVVAEDVKKHLYGLKCDLYEVRGRMNGQTLLPMPLNVAKVYQVHRDLVDRGQVLDGAAAEPGGHLQPAAGPARQEDGGDPRTDRVGVLPLLQDPFSERRGRSGNPFSLLLHPALTEVRDICVYIKPVEELMEHIGTLEFPDVAEMLPAVMHTVCLLWGNSRYYCTSPRIILLIKEISNQLIRQSSDCLDPSSLFQGELDEAQERVTMCIETLQNFKEVFEESRGNLGSGYFKNSEPVMWNFKSKIVFERLNQYIERLEKVQTVFDAGVEYSKLEKVEIGGLKGRILGQKVEELFEEFKNIFSGFTKIEYDPLNPDDRSFEKDEVVFKDNMKDLEGRLAAIITQAFDDCANFESLSKLIQVAGSLMDRSIAKEDMKERMPRVLEVYSKDLDVVKVIFDEYREAKEENGFYDVDCYFPPTAGAMTFVHKLRCRIQAPMEFFSEWENPIVETPDMEHVRHKYDEMKEKLDGLWDSLYSEWAARVPNEVNTNLAKTLLTRHEDNTISTNFAPELVAALRECRYLQFLDLLDNVPAPAKELFDRSEELHLWVTTLNRIVECAFLRTHVSSVMRYARYNEILKRCIPVEFDLIREEMNGIDNYIQEVQDKLNWKSDGVWPYVENIRDLTRALHGRVVQAQANVEHITGLLDNFAHIPLFERDEKAGLLALADRTTRVNKRFTEVRAAADQIHLKMDENYKLFHNVPLEEPEPEAPPRKKRLKKRFDDDGNEIPWDEGEEEWESYDEDEEGEEEHVEEEEEEESSSEESSESSEELWSSDSEMGGRKAVKEQAVEGWDFDTLQSRP